MNIIKSLVILIVAFVALSCAADTTYSSFKVTTLAAGSACATTPAQIAPSTCSSSCGSILQILPVADKTNQFTFNVYGATDDKCAAAANPSLSFTCVDSTSTVTINEDFSLVCVAQVTPTPTETQTPTPTPASSEHKDSSDATSIIASLSLVLFGLIASLAL